MGRRAAGPIGLSTATMIVSLQSSHNNNNYDVVHITALPPPLPPSLPPPQHLFNRLLQTSSSLSLPFTINHHYYRLRALSARAICLFENSCIFHSGLSTVTIIVSLQSSHNNNNYDVVHITALPPPLPPSLPPPQHLFNRLLQTSSSLSLPFTINHHYLRCKSGLA